MIRRAPLPKAIRSRALHLIFFKFPIRPRLALGTFVGNVILGFVRSFSRDTLFGEDSIDFQRGLLKQFNAQGFTSHYREVSRSSDWEIWRFVLNRRALQARATSDEREDERENRHCRSDTRPLDQASLALSRVLGVVSPVPAVGVEPTWG